MKMYKTVFTSLVLASVLATQVYAADMSGWSDKTVCRLVKAGGEQEYIDEATKRGLGCASPTVKSVAVSSSSTKVDPIDAIIVPQNWQPIKNKKIFDQERQVVEKTFENKKGFYWKGATVEHCFLDVMQNFEAYMKVEVDKTEGGPFDAYHKPISICLLAMSEQLSRIGTTPDYLQDMMLTWATNEVFKFPSKNKPASEYQLRTYAMASYLGVFGGYYAIHANEFDYTDEERQIVESYFSKQLIKSDMSKRAPRGLKACDFYSPSRLAKGLNNGKINVDTCGSPMLKSTTGAIALGLRLGDQDLFDAGIKNLKLLFRVFDEEGIFIPYAASRGASALGYSSEIPLHLGALTELFDTVGYDFLEHKTPNGMLVKDLVAAQINILNDPDMLLKYTAKNGAYGGTGGPTVAMFNKLSLIEKWSYSNTGIKQVVRQSARYVDRFRQDLQEFRDQNYVSVDQHGHGIKSTDDHMIIDPYMLYVANNDITPYIMIDVDVMVIRLPAELTALDAYKSTPEYDILKTKAQRLVALDKYKSTPEYDILKTKAQKGETVISLKWQQKHTKEGLVSWLDSVKWEGSLDDALSLDGSLGDAALADGVYALNYIWVNGNGKTKYPRVQKRSMDKVTVLNGKITHEAKPGHNDPVQSQRKTMKFEMENGIITAVGTLQYNPDQPLEETTFRGVMGTGFLIGTVTERDIVVLHLTKW
jgi:hypothetical protein